MATLPEPPNAPFPDHLAEEIGKHLQLTLVELIALSLAGKQLHWTVYGREFISVHRFLDQAVEEWRELEDVVAERAATIGIAPDGSPAAVIEFADMSPIESAFTEAGTAIERIGAQVWEVALRVRQRADRLAELDLVSQDVLVGVSRKLEADLWIMRAQLPD